MRMLENFFTDEEENQSDRDMILQSDAENVILGTYKQRGSSKQRDYKGDYI